MWIKLRGHRDWVPMSQPPPPLLPHVRRGAHPAAALEQGTLPLFQRIEEKKECVVPLILRRAGTCRLKLGARRRKEKGGREREIDHGEVSQVNMEIFSSP